MNSRLLEFKPPRIAQFLVAVAVQFHWATPLRLDLFANSVLGSMLIAIGFCTMTAGWWLFRKQHTAICPYEEDSLLRIFADEFLRYKARVRRWL